MKVLFIGNSHTYFNDMPETFKEICRANKGISPDVFMLAYSGRDLKWHNEEYCSLRFNILYGGFDYCVIQQLGHPFPGEDVTEEGLAPILKMCKSAGVTPVIYETWAEKYRPEYQKVISSAYRRIADKTDNLLLPIGEIFEEAMKSFPEIELFHTDGEHASVIGDYLIALSLFRLIFPNTTVSAPCTAHNFHNDEDSGRYSQIANVSGEIHNSVLESINAILKS